jgi:predicted Rossmann fold nucleotide-binding protein DprA/Smf involved in DNA uptake
MDTDTAEPNNPTRQAAQGRGIADTVLESVGTLALCAETIARKAQLPVALVVAVLERYVRAGLIVRTAAKRYLRKQYPMRSWQRASESDS